MWDELGRLLEFMKRQGLLPEHRLLDLGCGCLRGGIHFIEYLDEANYHGLDINSSLIEAGKMELANLGLTDKRPDLFVDDKFEASKFDTEFDFVLAFSVFTHIFMNHILRCLVEVRKVMKTDARFYATFFQRRPTLHTLNHCSIHLAALQLIWIRTHFTTHTKI